MNKTFDRFTNLSLARKRTTELGGTSKLKYKRIKNGKKSADYPKIRDNTEGLLYIYIMGIPNREKIKSWRLHE